MATTTNYYGLTKPAYTDQADVAALNGNMDAIDTAMNNNAQAASGAQQAASEAQQAAAGLDMRVTALEQGGGSGGAVLLWENPAPTSDFAAQTVTLSQSAENFDYLMFVVISNKNQSDRYYVWTAGNNAGQTQLSCFALNQQANPNNGYHLMLQQRTATVNGTSVAITKNIYFRTDANSAWVGDANRQDLCIPLKIYGMKL